jgi:CO/xanthine dehydrogenase Mo-binding subunit
MNEISKNRIFGAPIKRIEDEKLITGRGLFSGDVRLPGEEGEGFARIWSRRRKANAD